MKKVVFALIVISVFLAGTALAGNDVMYGYKYGTFQWTGLTLDHTYHCAYKNGVRHCWSWTGGERGGYVVPYSGGRGNYGDAKCTSTNLGCRFVYLVHGVCHQEANRGLHTANRTISRAAGYWASSAAFGRYGNGATWNACKTACWLWW